MTSAAPAEDLVTGICADLLRIDTSNYGDGSGFRGGGPGSGK